MQKLQLNRDLTLTSFKNKVTIRGRTRNYVQELKNLGGKWNRYIKAWIFHPTKRAEIVRHFRPSYDNESGLSETSVLMSRNQNEAFKDAENFSDVSTTETILTKYAEVGISIDKHTSKLRNLYCLFFILTIIQFFAIYRIAVLGTHLIF